MSTFEDKKIINTENETKIEEFEEIKESLTKDIENNLFLKSHTERCLPRVQLEDNIFTDIKNLANVTTKSMMPTITFFGEKNKVLIYDIHNDNLLLLIGPILQYRTNFRIFIFSYFYIQNLFSWLNLIQNAQSQNSSKLGAYPLSYLHFVKD